MDGLLASPLLPPSRLPPADLGAEQSLLGGILTNNRFMDRVSEILSPDHFAEPLHARIYTACQSMIEAGRLANPTTLFAALGTDEATRKDAASAKIELSVYLGQLAGAAVSIGILDYARLLRDLYLRRELIAIGEDIANAAHAPSFGEEPEQHIEDAESRLFDLASNRNVQSAGLVPFEKAAHVAMQAAEDASKRQGLVGMTTGLIDLDYRTGGLRKGDVIVVGGRPSMGKSSLILDICRAAAISGSRIALFSLEMSDLQLGSRLLSWRSRVPLTNIVTGRMSMDELRRVAVAHSEISGLLGGRFMLDQTPGLTIGTIRQRARRMKRKGGLEAIAIDHLHLVGSPAETRLRRDNRVQELSQITGAVKVLAKELDVPVILGAQLSRANAQRDDRRPQLQDLRDSGSIEQDADVVMFVHRDEYYLEREEPKRRADEHDDRFKNRQATWEEAMNEARGVGEIIVAKQRQGAIGAVKVQWDNLCVTFGNAIRDGNHQ